MILFSKLPHWSRNYIGDKLALRHSTAVPSNKKGNGSLVEKSLINPSLPGFFLSKKTRAGQSVPLAKIYYPAQNPFK